MNLQSNHIYHIFNQGNNKQNIFFIRDNYLFFLEKLNQYILPYSDILAWCLMPNHFHLMVYVHTFEIDAFNTNLISPINSLTPSETINNQDSPINSLTLSEAINNQDSRINCFTPSEAINNQNPSDFINSKTRTFNDSIGLLLRTYTRAINNQEKRTGSLFRPHSKAVCISDPTSFSSLYFNTCFGTKLNVTFSDKEYPSVCFKYIHENPVSAKIVFKPEDWEFSSCRDYAGLRNGKLINRQRAEYFGLSINNFT